jgi:hypothetical protein
MRKLIVISSLPRSGSTVLQRIISTDNKFSTFDESWLFPSIISITKNNQISSILNHKTSVKQMKRVLPNLDKVLIKSIIEELHLKYGNYIIEKTPRNYMITQELSEFIEIQQFLIVRNPLFIIKSSLSNLFSSNLRHIHGYLVDYIIGIPKIIEAAKSKKINLIKYEELTDFDFDKFDIKVDLFNLPTNETTIGDNNRENKFNSKNKFNHLNYDIIELLFMKIVLKKYFKRYFNFFEYNYEAAQKKIKITPISFFKKTVFINLINLMRSMIIIFFYFIYNTILNKKNKWLPQI